MPATTSSLPPLNLLSAIPLIVLSLVHQAMHATGSAAPAEAAGTSCPRSVEAARDDDSHELDGR
jgi:hypothetical protein